MALNYQIQFLEPESEEKKTLYTDFYNYIESLKMVSEQFHEYGYHTRDYLEKERLGLQPGVQESNYPYYDDIECAGYKDKKIACQTRQNCNTCGMCFSHLIGRMRQSECLNSGCSCLDLPTTVDPKWNELRTTWCNQYLEIGDKHISCLMHDAYEQYMLQNGLMLAVGVNPIFSLLTMVESSPVFQNTSSPIKIMIANFRRKFGDREYLITMFTYPDSQTGMTQLEDLSARINKSSGNQNYAMAASETYFNEEIMTMRYTANNYTVTSKRFKQTLDVLSIFEATIEFGNVTIKEIDMNSYMNAWMVGLYGVKKTELVTDIGKEIYLLEMPYHTNQVYGVLTNMNLPLKSVGYDMGEDENKISFIMAVSDKVKVDKFVLVDGKGNPIPADKGTIEWKKVSELESWSDCPCNNTVVQPTDEYVESWNITVDASIDCFIKIESSSIGVESENMFPCGLTDCIPIVPPVYYENYNTLYNHRTPRVKTIYIPFCKGIDEINPVIHWVFKGEVLKDMLQLYQVHHNSSVVAADVHRELINDNIQNIQFIPGSNLETSVGVGWFPVYGGYDCGCNCVIPSHQTDQYYMRIELKEPIEVLTCTGFVVKLFAGTIRFTSPKGVYYNAEQEVSFHVTAVPDLQDCHNDKYVLRVTKSHIDGVPVILPKWTGDYLTTNWDIRKYNDTCRDDLYQFTYCVLSKDGMLDLTKFRENYGDDKVHIYYKDNDNISDNLGTEILFNAPPVYTNDFSTVDFSKERPSCCYSDCCIRMQDAMTVDKGKYVTFLVRLDREHFPNGFLAGSIATITLVTPYTIVSDSTKNGIIQNHKVTFKLSEMGKMFQVGDSNNYQ